MMLDMLNFVRSKVILEKLLKRFQQIVEILVRGCLWIHLSGFPFSACLLDNKEMVLCRFVQQISLKRLGMSVVSATQIML